MDALKMAQAIARFRLLRSLGNFAPAGPSGHYTFELDRSGLKVERLHNGAPRDAAPLTIRQLTLGFESHLALLCETHVKAQKFR